MIKAYLAWMATGYEGEDVEVRYSIYKDEELLDKQAIFIDYQKPLLAGQFATRLLLEKLDDYRDQEITIIINDGALFEVVQGTSTSKNREFQNMGEETRRELERFEDIEFQNISGSHIDIVEWSEILKF